MNPRHLCALTAIGLSASLPATAAPFAIDASSIMGGPAPIRVEGSSLPDLLENLILAEGHFLAFDGFETQAAATYLGVEHAINVFLNASGTEAQLYIPSTGLNRLFMAGTREELEQQIEDWLEGEGLDEFAAFLDAMDAQSAASVNDGNPQATTARTATSVFFATAFSDPTGLDFGDDAGGAGAGSDIASSSGDGSRRALIGIGFNGGQFEADGIEGTNMDIDIPFSFGVSDNVRIAGTVPLSYVDLDGASIYGVGLNVGVPVRVARMSRDQPVTWVVAPSTGTVVRASEDIAAGAAIYNFGFTSSLDVRVARRWIISMGNHVSYYNSFALEYDDYEFEPEIDQVIVKNGLRVVTPIAHRWVAQGYVVDTRFLNDAAVESYETVGAAVSYKTTRSISLTLGANADFGDDFSSWAISASSAWKF